jgi:hypothetical protein
MIMLGEPREIPATTFVAAPGEEETYPD